MRCFLLYIKFLIYKFMKYIKYYRPISEDIKVDFDDWDDIEEEKIDDTNIVVGGKAIVEIRDGSIVGHHGIMFQEPLNAPRRYIVTIKDMWYTERYGYVFTVSNGAPPNYVFRADHCVAWDPGWD